MPRVTIYTRPGCRLCEEAKGDLLEAFPSVSIEEVSIDDDPSLRRRFGVDIPVAIARGRELFRHRFDPRCVRWLRSR